MDPLDTDANALVQTAAHTDATYSVTNVNYNAQMVETSADFNNAFSAMLQEQGGEFLTPLCRDKSPTQVMCC